MSLLQGILWIGDLITLVVFTLVGFWTHDNLDADPQRMLATFVPMLVAWLVAAAPAGALDLKSARDFRQFWRPGWAMFLAGPLAVTLRGLILNRPVAPLFALILAGSGVIAIFIWRGLFALLAARLPK